MSDKPMDDKDQVDAYINRYKQQMDRYSRTQEIEWKGNFGVWALLAGAVYFAGTNRSIAIPLCFIGPMLLVLTLVHMGWLLNIHSSERFDKKLWAEYRLRASQIIQPNAPDEGTFKHSWIKEAVWILLEVGVTTLLSLALLALLFWRS
jgi:hypothetical protein